jgi:anthranilate synthase
MSHLSYTTPGGIAVTRTFSRAPYKNGLVKLLRRLDTTRGIYLSSGYEYPGRYSRWDIASVAPPLEVISRGRDIEFNPLNKRGEVLCEMLHGFLAAHPHWESVTKREQGWAGRLKPLPKLFSEEERSHQPSVFSILRAILKELGNEQDTHLAFAGAFGYDLLFQFDPIELKLPRDGVKDLHLYLCDDIYLMDRKKEQIEHYQYDFVLGALTTKDLPRDGEKLKSGKGAASLAKQKPATITSDHTAEEYMAGVEKVRRGMKQGDYYEVVLRQTFRALFTGKASEFFERVQKASPSPYEFLMQFGDEQLIGASPEVFVRVEGTRIDTCPIAGTARRTGDPMKDADAIRDLLGSLKEESELTMCTDVDRNDKSRISVPGSVKVIGRRLIESYAGIFHTVDHVESTLAPGFDSLDAFLSHMWAVTVIGAPKKAAAQEIENTEKTPRGWYAGAVGMISMNGDMNTGILIRTAHIRNGVAAYPAGATLLYDSIPEAEHLECRQKATGFFRAMGVETVPESKARPPIIHGDKVKLLLVDHDDCFIHTLANYARQTGADVVTYRAGFPLSLIAEIKPDIILVSPGPGRPQDFGVPALVRYAADGGIPVFGVCLGLQGIVEAFGGELGVLDYPMHGKPSIVRHRGVGVFEGLPEEIKVGRYHSLYAIREKLPAVLEVTAESEDGVIMGVRHRELPVEGVQFHPESLLTLEGEAGLKIIENMVRQMRVRRAVLSEAAR